MRLSTPRSTATPTTSTATWFFPRTFSRRSRPRASSSQSTSGVPWVFSSHVAGSTTKYTGLSRTSSSSAGPSALTPLPDCPPMDSILLPTTFDTNPHFNCLRHPYHPRASSPSTLLEKPPLCPLGEGVVPSGNLLLCGMCCKKEREGWILGSFYRLITTQSLVFFF